MNKQIASNIVNSSGQDFLLNPGNNGNVSWANINASKAVWWIDIPVRKFESDLYLILNDARQYMFYLVPIAAKVISDPYYHFRKLREDYISVEISSRDPNKFIDIKSKGTGFDFNKFPILTYDYAKNKESINNSGSSHYRNTLSLNEGKNNHSIHDGTNTVRRRRSVNNTSLSHSNNSTKNSRYKNNAIGNSQNLFIRNILSNLGNESFTASDWTDTKKFFGNKCAYCGEEKNLIMEHAIPINKTNLGEHRLGNLVPSCKECNNNKHDKHFNEFLADQPERLDRIKNYMEEEKYTPLSNNENSESITEILNMAHKEIGDLASRYVTLINKLL